MSALAALLLTVLPGAPLAAQFLDKGGDASKLFRISVVISLLLASVIGWAPMGSWVPLAAWLLILGLMAAWGVWTFASRLRQRSAERSLDNRISFVRCLSLGALAISALILLVRPNIDWDAVDYYLLSAIDAVLNGHYTVLFSHHVELASHAPNTVLPAIPSLYALAIQVAGYLHESPDTAIRLIAFAFILGIWLSSREIAAHYMNTIWTEVAGLFSIVIPGMLFAIVSVPLLLDLSFTFLMLELVALLHEATPSNKTLLMIGLTASALTIDKIDGLPGFVLIAAVFALLSLPRLPAIIGILLLEVLLTIAAVHVHLLDARTPPQIYVAIVAVSAFLTSAIAMRQPRASFPWSRLYVIAIGFVPGIFEIAKLTNLTGSPAGYYLPSLARHQTSSWLAAVDMINRAHVYAPSTQPGVPDNFGLGLLLWWGLGPPLMLGSVYAAILALRRRDSILALFASIAIFELAFLTIFGLQDFRHILPVLPLTAIAIAYGFANWPEQLGDKRVAVLLAAAMSIPFAWAAQQRFFGSPSPLAVFLQIDQWQELSNGGLRSALLIVLATLALMAIFAVALRAGARQKLSHQYAHLVFATLVFIAWFAPLISTAISPGLSLQRRIVEYNQDNGYIPALTAVMRSNPHETTLTFENFGISWYSRGTQRRVELTDATDLEILLPLLNHYGLRAFHKLGIRSAILPAPKTAAYQAFLRLTHTLDHPELTRLYSKDLSTVTQYGGWYVLAPKAQRGWE